MKTLKFSELSDKMFAFLFKVALIISFLLIALVGNALAQYSEKYPDPIGYDWKMDNFSPMNELPLRAYLVYDSNLNYDFNWEGNLIFLDTVYLNYSGCELKEIDTLSLKKIISRVYFCNKEKELLFYINTKTRISQSDWPKEDHEIYSIYGSRIRNNIYLRQEKEISNTYSVGFFLIYKFYIAIFLMFFLIMFFFVELPKIRKRIQRSVDYSLWFLFLTAFSSIFIPELILLKDYIGAGILGFLFIVLVLIDIAVHKFLKKKFAKAN